MNSRYLLYEAQQAHYYGLPHNLALASVTSTPATVLGYDHRIGYIKLGMFWRPEELGFNKHMKCLGYDAGMYKVISSLILFDDVMI